MYNAQPKPNRVDEGTPAYHSGPQSMVGNYYVDADATNEPAGMWTRPDLTDEQLAELNPRTRTSIEHARKAAGWGYAAHVITKPGYGDREILVFRDRPVDDDASQRESTGAPVDTITLEGATDTTHLLWGNGWRVIEQYTATESGYVVAVEKVDRGGRPAIGPRVHVALPESLLAFIDDYAATTREDVKEATTRAEAIRSLLELARQVIEGQPVDVAEWVANGGLSECHPDDFDRN